MSLDAECLLEALLLTQNRAVPAKELREQFEPVLSQRQFLAVIEALRKRWYRRGLALSETAQGWRFYAVAEVTAKLEHLHAQKPPRYSRAVMETLAIIAYQQPVTRGDIETIRGVSVSTQVIQTLSERGWIECVGHKDSLGKPALWATTNQFLSDLNLQDLGELPPLTELGHLIAPETSNPAANSAAEEPLFED